MVIFKVLHQYNMAGGPLMGFLDLGWHILAAGTQFCTVISQRPAVMDCLVFCGRTAQTLLYIFMYVY